MNEETCSCRSCGSAHLHPVIDLGMQPLANRLLSSGQQSAIEQKFPLEVLVCGDCWLMQITHIVPPAELFSDYVYFSSFSDEMLSHASEVSLRLIKEKDLDGSSFVVEVASNDGYLLKNFVEAGVPCLGFEPAENTAEVARAGGVETRGEFFGRESAEALMAERRAADLILANNVFAHAPDPNDFVAGLSALLASDGWAVIEFPYGVDLIEKAEFDTIYHEHVFYFTLTPLIPLFARHGLEIFHVERIPIHGGSLRIFAARRGVEAVRKSITAVIDRENETGVATAAYYGLLCERARQVKEDLVRFLDEKRKEGKRVAAYGASAKGSTLLNYIGAAAKTIEFIADRSTYKHGKLSPGLHLSIVPSEELAMRVPDFAILLVWNFSTEVLRQQAGYQEKGGRFVIPLPQLNVVAPT